MPPFEARVDGARVVVDATPMMTLGDAVAACAAKLRATRGATTTMTIETTDGAAPTHEVTVDGARASSEDLRTAIRYLNHPRGARVEARRREGREEGARTTTMSYPTTRRATTTTTTTTTEKAVEATGDETGDARALDALGRAFRVIRREVEIEEGPNDAGEDLPEAFYELTTTDAAALMKRSREEPVLMTKKMREAAAMGKPKPTRAAIRFTLPPPSDLVVEASFAASERVRDLYEFVARCARDRAVAESVELFVTPPKRVFSRNDDATLLSAGLAPAARVRVGAKGATSFASARDAEALLRADLIALAAEPAKPTVRVVENGSNLALDDAEPEKTQAQKKAAVTNKLMGHLMGRR
jgi:hypothetical protein